MKNQNAKSTSTKATSKSASAQEAVATTITLTSPKGKQHVVSNLPKFATRYNLDASNLRKVANGTRNTHRGWTRAV